MQPTPAGWPDDTTVTRPRAAVDWAALERPPATESLTVEHAITTDLPAQVAGVTGPGIAAASLEVTRGEAVSDRPVSPWGSVDEPQLPRPNEPVTVDVGYGDATLRVFTGAVYRGRGSALSTSAGVSCDDQARRLRSEVTLDPMGSTASPFLSGISLFDPSRWQNLTSLWALDVCARGAGFHATIPPPQGIWTADPGQISPPAIVHVPMQGGLAPLPDSGHTRLSRPASSLPDWPAPPWYEPAPWGYGVWTDGSHPRSYAPRQPVGWGSGGQSFYLQAHFDSSVDAEVVVRFVDTTQRLRLRVEGGSLQALLSDNVIVSLPGPISGPCRAVFHHTGNQLAPQTVRLQAPDGRSATGTTTFNRTSNLVDFVETTGQSAGVSVQRVPGVDPPADHVGDWEPTFLPDVSLNRLTAIPWTPDADRWDLAAEIAEAEGGGVWCDEHGRLVFRNRLWLNDVGRPIDGTVTSRDSIADLAWEMSRDWAYRYVSVPWQPVRNRRIATKDPLGPGTGWVTAHAPTSGRRFSLSGLQQLGDEGERWFVDLDGEAIDLSTDVTQPGCQSPRSFNMGSYCYVGDATRNDTSEWQRCSNPGLGGRPHANPRLPQAIPPTNPVTVDIDHVEPARAEVILRYDQGHPTVEDISLAGNGGLAEPGPIIRARQVLVYGDPETEIRDLDPTRPDSLGDWLTIRETRWRQDRDDAAAYATWIAEQVRNARPVVRTIDIVPDPRIQLGDHLEVHDPDITGLSARCLVVGSRLSVDARGAMSQQITVRPFEVRMIQTFEQSGTWSRPSGLRFVVVEVQGGGGGGGSAAATSSGQASAGAGGAAGGYSRKKIPAEQLAATVTVTVGTGGPGGDGGGSGSSGGASSFGTHCSASGGSGGGVSGAGSGNGSTGSPSGGSGSGGDLNIDGGAGAGAWRNGSNSLALAGEGGTSPLGAGGPRRIPATSGWNGLDGTGYGSGGSGASNISGQPSRPGGDGPGGVVVIEEIF